MIKFINQFLKSKSQSFILLVGLLLILFISILDYMTIDNFEFDFFYLLPLFIVTWFISAKAGFTIAVLAVFSWEIANKILDQTSFSWSTDLWNTSIELAIFYSFVYVLSELKHNFRKLEELANEDPLTGVANRRAFNQVADTELNRSRRFGSPFSIVYIDIDNFKAVNDSRGHNAGDAVLKKIATALRQNCRNIDTVARLGGDEFAILLPETNVEDTKKTVKRMKKLLNKFATDNQGAATFSIGIVAFSEPPTSTEEMIGIADKSMYFVKNQGKNSISFSTWPDTKKIS